MSMHLKKGVTDPKYVALVAMMQRLEAEDAKRRKDPKNRTEMKTTDGQICRFVEP
jgi:hypothetical protein